METVQKVHVYPDGRIMVPFRIRREIGILPGEELEITVINGKLIISNSRYQCTCGNPLDPDATLRKLGLCRECLAQAAEQHKQTSNPRTPSEP